jgi:hypothetical protein
LLLAIWHTIWTQNNDWDKILTWTTTFAPIAKNLAQTMWCANYAWKITQQWQNMMLNCVTTVMVGTHSRIWTLVQQ